MLNTAALRKTSSVLVVVGICLLFFFGIFLQQASASSKDTYQFNSRVVDQDGNAVADGQYNFRFMLFSSATGGSTLWAEDRSGVQIRRGAFSVDLGSQNPFPPTVWTDYPDLYIQVCFDANGASGDGVGVCGGRYEEQFSPRKKITAVPFAERAFGLGPTVIPEGGVGYSIVSQGGNGSIAQFMFDTNLRFDLQTSGDLSLTDGTSPILLQPGLKRMTLPADGDIFFGTSSLRSTANGSSGAGLIGVYNGNFSIISGNNVQQVLDSIDNKLSGGSCPTCFVDNGNSFGGLAVLGTNDNNSLALRTNGTERARLTNSGNLGLGTTTPSQMLELNNGNMQIDQGRIALWDATPSNNSYLSIDDTTHPKTSGDLYPVNINILTKSPGSIVYGEYVTISTDPGTAPPGTIRNFRAVTNYNTPATGTGLYTGISTLMNVTNGSPTIATGGNFYANSTSGMMTGELTGVRAFSYDFNTAGSVNLFYGFGGIDGATATAVSATGINSYLYNDNGGHITGDFIGASIGMTNFAGGASGGIVGGNMIGINDFVDNGNPVTGDLIGFNLFELNDYDATVANMYGFKTDFSRAGSPANNKYGMYLDALVGGANNAYGLYIKGPTTSGNNYALYVQSGLSQFAPATTAQASVNLATSGGINPTAANSGDLWWNGTNLYFNNGTSNIDLLAGGGGPCTTCFVNNGNAFGSMATIGTTDNNDLAFKTNNTEAARILANGNVGIGITNPAAYLGLAPATTTQTSLNLRSSAGTNVSSPNSGDLWWNGTNLNFYNGTSTIDLLASATGSYVNFAAGSTQTTAGTNGLIDVTTTGNTASALIKVNENGAGTPNLLDLETAGVPQLTISNSGLITGVGGATISGAAVSLNNNSNFAVNIATGTSTGLVTIGGIGTQTIAIGDGAGIKTVNLGSNTTTSTTSILSGSGAVNVNASNSQPTNINTGSSTGLISLGGGSATMAINTTSWDVSAAGAASGLTGLSSSGTIAFSGLNVNNGFVRTNGSGTLSTAVLGASDVNSFAFVQNGNAFGTTAVLGTTDANNLAFITNGTTQMTIDTSGHVGIGTTPYSGYGVNSYHTTASGDLTDAVFSVTNTAAAGNLTAITGNAQTYHNLSGYLTGSSVGAQNNAGSDVLSVMGSRVDATSYGTVSGGTVMGSEVHASNYNTTSTLSYLWGLMSFADNHASGSVTGQSRAIDAYTQNDGTVTDSEGLYSSFFNSAGANMTTNYGLYVDSGQNFGSITNQYGIYIGNIASGSTLNYAIYAAGGKSYFGGNVGIGITPNANNVLNISGTMTTGSALTGINSTVYNSTVASGGIEAVTGSAYAYSDINVNSLIGGDFSANAYSSFVFDVKGIYAVANNYTSSNNIRGGVFVSNNYSNANNSGLDGISATAAQNGTGTIGWLHGAVNQVSVNSTGGASQSWGTRSFLLMAGTGTLSTYDAFGADDFWTAAGNVNTYNGFYSRVNFITSGGTIGSYNGVHIENPQGTGTITSATGLLVENMTAGSTNYGLYIRGATNSQIKIDRTAGTGIEFAAGAASGANDITTSDNVLNIAGGVTMTGNCADGNGGIGGAADGCDIAETFASDVTLDKGELVKLTDNPGNDWKKVTSTTSHADYAIGIISTNPTVVMGNNVFTGNRSYPVGLAGVLPTKVTNQNGLIKRGDYITVSDLPGYGMKANNGDSTVGIALQDQVQTQDVINVLVSRNNKAVIADNTQTTNLQTELNNLKGQLDIGKINAAISLTDLIQAKDGVVVIAGKLQVGDITANSVTSKKVLGDDVSVKKLTVNSDSSGSIILPKGETTVTVANTSVTDKTSVMLTPNQLVIYRVKSITPGVGFEIEIDKAIDQDTDFTYLLIN